MKTLLHIVALCSWIVHCSLKSLPYDTIVVGLGSSGATAASTLAKAGKRVLALEAQDRVGGRVHTVPYRDGVIELGAGLQSDVEAPDYIRNDMKTWVPPRRGYLRYSGTKTDHGGTKTGNGGTNTSYGGTKTSYGGTKNGYRGYSGTKNAYGEGRQWDSTGSGSIYNSFTENVKQPYSSKCEISCKNNGICVDVNTCQCPPQFSGKYCEFENKPCLANPPLPKKSQRKCSKTECTVTCVEGHMFPDGTSVANMQCVEGQWQPTRANLTSIPDCQPECNPPCLNGGVCLFVNTCQCPADYRGPQCQYDEVIVITPSNHRQSKIKLPESDPAVRAQKLKEKRGKSIKAFKEAQEARGEEDGA